MNEDYMVVIIPYLAEVITADIPEKVRFLRFQAIRELQAQLRHYDKLGYMSTLLCAIAEKKCRHIVKVTAKAEMEKVMKPSCPHYNGAGFVPDAYSVPEEELICWSETSLRAPLNEAGFKRYMELFREILPDESKQIAI